jgi:hypothetical protein
MINSILDELRNKYYSRYQDSGFDWVEDIIKSAYSQGTKDLWEATRKDFELDADSHRQGRCSFSSMALCAAEEQRIKNFLHSLATKFISEVQNNK